MNNNLRRLTLDYSKINAIDEPYGDFKKLVSSDNLWERLTIKLKWNFYRRFFADPISVVKGVYIFLKLPPYEPSKVQVRNAPPKTFIEQKLRTELLEVFSPINR